MNVFRTGTYSVECTDDACDWPGYLGFPDPANTEALTHCIQRYHTVILLNGRSLLTEYDPMLYCDSPSSTSQR